MGVLGVQRIRLASLVQLGLENGPIRLLLLTFAGV